MHSKTEKDANAKTHAKEKHTQKGTKGIGKIPLCFSRVLNSIFSHTILIKGPCSHTFMCAVTTTNTSLFLFIRLYIHLGFTSTSCSLERAVRKASLSLQK